MVAAPFAVPGKLSGTERKACGGSVLLSGATRKTAQDTFIQLRCISTAAVKSVKLTTD